MGNGDRMEEAAIEAAFGVPHEAGSGCRSRFGDGGGSDGLLRCEGEGGLCLLPSGNGGGRWRQLPAVATRRRQRRLVAIGTRRWRRRLGGCGGRR